LLRKWLRNVFHVEDGAYETPIFAYSRELDVLVSANSITRSDLEEESSPPYSKNVMMDSKKEMMNLKNTTPVATP
jgi:Leucine-rich repeat (LRR) protein